MKQAVLLLLVCSAVLFSCSKSDSNVVTKTPFSGTWQLAETLADIGNGSGTWQPATEPLLLTFTTDGRIEGTAFPQARRYVVTSDKNIRFIYADSTFINYNYSLVNTTLVLSGGGCIEACGLKFKKQL